MSVYREGVWAGKVLPVSEVAFSPGRFNTTSPTPQALPGVEIAWILWKKHFQSQRPSRVLQ